MNYLYPLVLSIAEKHANENRHYYVTKGFFLRKRLLFLLISIYVLRKVKKTGKYIAM